MTNSSDKLNDLRTQLQSQKLEGYLIPKEDEWQGEYLPEAAERLKWLTGFTGSAGVAIVLNGKACVFSDGRYELQLRDELSGSAFEPQDHKPSGDDKNVPVDYIIANVKDGAVIGYDPRLLTSADVKSYEEAFEKSGKNIQFKPVKQNLVDAIWTNRPAMPQKQVRIYPDKLAGKSSATKRSEIGAQIKEAGADRFFIAAPDSIAWLLNIRGDDVPMTPFALSFAALSANGDVDWFVLDGQITAANEQTVKSHIGKGLKVHPLKDIDTYLASLGNETVLINDDLTPAYYKGALEAAGADVISGQELCQNAKAVKNDTEQASIKDIHIQDGVALAKFLKWTQDDAGQGGVTEIDVENTLRSLRRQQPDYEQDSFDTIAGWAQNGAVIHYHATPAKHETITSDNLLLIDSGGQYAGGTTDITRTVAIGTPTQEMRENFTRVLKGHIQIARLRFPQGIKSQQIDVLARAALWQNDLDYKHGTGHGVGCNLSVHEGGVSISLAANHEFKAGMLVSNEPGFYKGGAYGIRIENLIMVEEDGTNEITDKVMLRFNTVSLAPIDHRLIVADMLSFEEKAWLDNYHEGVYQAISAHLDQSEAEWLRAETLPIDQIEANKKGSGLSPKPS